MQGVDGAVEAEVTPSMKGSAENMKKKKKRGFVKPVLESSHQRESAKGVDVSLPKESLVRDALACSALTNAMAVDRGREGNGISPQVYGEVITMNQKESNVRCVPYPHKERRLSGGSMTKSSFSVLSTEGLILPVLFAEESIASTHNNADSGLLFPFTGAKLSDAGETCGRDPVSSANVVWAGGRNRQRRQQMRQPQQPHLPQNQGGGSHGNHHQEEEWGTFSVHAALKDSDGVKREHLSNELIPSGEMQPNREGNLRRQTSVEAASTVPSFLELPLSVNCIVEPVRRQVFRIPPPPPPSSNIFLLHGNANRELTNPIEGETQGGRGLHQVVGPLSEADAGRRRTLCSMMMEPPAPVTWAQYRQCRRLLGYPEACKVSQEVALQYVLQRHLGGHLGG